MLSIQFIINIFKETKAIQVLYFFLLLSILQVLDLFLTIFLTHIFGEYLLIALLCSLSIIGIYLSIFRVKHCISLIKELCDQGKFPEKYFFEVTGIFTAASLIFIPGFMSDFIGLILLIPIISVKAGSFMSTKTDTDWHTVYEYMKL